jgi:hypothetical protein
MFHKLEKISEDLRQMYEMRLFHCRMDYRHGIMEDIVLQVSSRKPDIIPNSTHLIPLTDLRDRFHLWLWMYQQAVTGDATDVQAFMAARRLSEDDLFGYWPEVFTVPDLLGFVDEAAQNGGCGIFVEDLPNQLSSFLIKQDNFALYCHYECCDPMCAIVYSATRSFYNHNEEPLTNQAAPASRIWPWVEKICQAQAPEWTLCDRDGHKKRMFADGHESCRACKRQRTNLKMICSK